MISILVGILVGIASIASIVAFIASFAPDIVKWFNSSIDFVMQMSDYLPTWILPYFLVAIAIALISLGVKLL